MADQRPAPRYSRTWNQQAGGRPVTTRKVVTHKARLIFFTLAGMMALAGGIIALILMPRPKPAAKAALFLSLPVTQYDKGPYPGNPYARQDSDALVRHFATSDPATLSQDAKPLLNKLDKLTKDEEHNPVIVHLSALAVYHDGQVYVLASDAVPDKPDTWIPLRVILEKIGKCPSPNKLLLLDIMAPFADPRLGILADDVADHVHDELEKLKKDGDLSFFVLCACSRGEVTHPWEEEGQTAFGYFLDLGLEGAADGFLGDGADRKISVTELAAFVQVRVQRWARKARDVKQTPVLYKAENDFDLADTYEDRKAKPTPATFPDKYPKWLKDRWKQRDDAWDKGAAAYGGPWIAEMDAVLLQAEHRWQGGIGDQRAESDLNIRLKEFPAIMQNMQTKLQRSPPPRSIAQLKRDKDLKADPDIKTALKELFKLKGWNIDATLANEVEKVQVQALATKEAVLGEKLNEKPATPALQAAILEAFVDDLKALLDDAKSPITDPFAKLRGQTRLVPDKLQFLGSVLDRLQWTDVPRLAEINYLDMLTRADLPKRWNRSSQKLLTEAILAYLQAVQEGEMIAASAGPRVLPWIKSALADADAKRREELPFILRTKDQPAGEVETGEAGKIVEKMNKVLENYQKITPSLKVIDEGYRVHDEVAVYLPQLVPYFAQDAENLQDPNSRWFRATSGWQRLHRALVRPSGSSSATTATPDELRSMVNAIGRDDLIRSFDENAFNALLDREQSGTATDYRQLQRSLASPRWTAEQRAKLWEAWRRLAEKLHQDVLKDEPAGSGSAKPSIIETRGEPDLEERARALRRARLTLDLLKLAGYFDDRQSDEQSIRDELQLHEGTADNIYAAGEKLRLALGTYLPEALGKKLKDGKTEQADLLSRAFYPLDFRDIDARDLSGYPALKLRESELVVYWRALATRYEAEADEKALPGENSLPADYIKVIRRSLKEISAGCQQQAGS